MKILGIDLGLRDTGICYGTSPDDYEFELVVTPKIDIFEMASKLSEKIKSIKPDVCYIEPIYIYGRYHYLHRLLELNGIVKWEIILSGSRFVEIPKRQHKKLGVFNENPHINDAICLYKYGWKVEC